MKPGLWRNKNSLDIDYKFISTLALKNGGHEAKVFYIRRDWGSGPRVLNTEPDTIQIAPGHVQDWMRLDS